MPNLLDLLKNRLNRKIHNGPSPSQPLDLGRLLSRGRQQSLSFLWTLLLSPPRPGRGVVLRFLSLWSMRFVGLLFAGLLALHVNLFWLFGSSPSLESIQNPDLAIGSEVWSADSVLLGRYWLEDRTPVTRDQIPEILVNALVSTEDARFFQHNGVDLIAPFAVVWSMTKGDARGGSTLTQQLAKNLYNTRRATSRGLLGGIPGVRQVIWKTKEWITAVQLEALHSKDEILTLYLNTVSFGGNTYGIQSAARFFFDTDPALLNAEQAALLVGVLKAPTYYSPLQNPTRALARRNVVLGLLEKHGHLRPSQTDSLSKLPIDLKLRVANPEEGTAPWYRAELARWLKDWCRQNGYNLQTDGLVIRTTLDARLQAKADSAVHSWMQELQRRFISHWNGEEPWRYSNGQVIPRYLDSVALLSPAGKRILKENQNDTAKALEVFKTKQMRRVFTWKGTRDTNVTMLDSIRMIRTLLQTGFIAMDPTNGAVRAWVGGIDHPYFPWDHVSQSRRQPGSTFKPFVYATALLQGHSPCEKLIDKPITITYEEKGEIKRWSPHNSDWTNTHDSMTLRHALGRSINTVTAQLTEIVTPRAVANTARRQGIRSPLEEVPSIGLGPNPVTMLELVTAYIPFTNGGKLMAPWFVDRIEDRHGRVLAVFRPQPKQVLPPKTAWLMQYMLKGGLEEPLGTSQNLWSFDLFADHAEMGGKTGTSSDHADGWFVGITPQLIMAAWTGADDPSIHFRTGVLGEGAKTALPIVGKFLESAYRDPRTGLRPGRFPKAPDSLGVRWNCPTPWDRYANDSTAVDSLLDSTATALPEDAVNGSVDENE